jgi:hypothetical protein
MANLVGTYLSFDALEIQDRINRNDSYGAKELVCAALLAGTTDLDILRIAANMILPPARGRGRPKRGPARWPEIGPEFERCRDRGITYEQTVVALAAQFSMSESKIEKAARYYRVAREQADDEV